MKTDNPDNNSEQGFGMPDGYYRSAAARTRHSIACLEELKDLENLILLKKTHPFLVPASYFEEEPEVRSNAVIDNINPEKPFLVPVGFFVEQQKQLLGLLPLEATSPASVKSGAKIRSLFPLRLRVAVAAMLVVLMGIWLYRIAFDDEAAQDCRTIACLDKHEVLGGSTLENFSEEELMQLIDDEQLERELMEGSSNAPGPDSIRERDRSLKKQDV